VSSRYNGYEPSRGSGEARQVIEIPINIWPSRSLLRGTSRLARRLITVLSDMTLTEAIETARIPGVASQVGEWTAWVTAHTSRAPRHPPCLEGVRRNTGAPCRDHCGPDTRCLTASPSALPY
jgi:hypothetical protein